MSEKTGKPNIFKYATKELSQDAMICWLIEWAGHDGQENKKLRECGLKFIEALFDKHDEKIPDKPWNLRIRQQDNKIDVLARIGDYVLLIEDKTDTGDHSDQLRRYYEAVLRGWTEAVKAEEEKNVKILPIYLKTGNQSRFERLKIKNLTSHEIEMDSVKIKPNPYKVFDRSDLLKVVEPYMDAHPILNDFVDYLNCWEDDTQRYKKWGKEGSWSWKSCQGFFRELENDLEVLDEASGVVRFAHDQNNENMNWSEKLWWDWHWVNNAAGGFACFYWYGKEIEVCDKEVSLYLQLELKLGEPRPDKPSNRKLCVKVDASDFAVEDRPKIRDECRDQIVEAGNGLLRKPDRMGRGKTMTVAQWNDEQTPWLVFNETDGGPDILKTVKNLVKAQCVLDKAFDKQYV